MAYATHPRHHPYRAAPRHVSFADRLSALYVGLALIFLSLQSVYVAQAGGAVVTYFGLMMLVPMIRYPIKPLTFWTTGLLMLGLIFTFVSAEEADTKAVLGTILSASALVIIPAVFAKQPGLLSQAVRWAIYAHAGMIALQVAYFAAFRTYLDPLSMLGVAEQAVMSKKGLELSIGRVPRFAGLSNEPGTHATIMVGLLAAEYAISRRISRAMIFGLVSVFATVSLGGIMLASLFCGIIGIHQFFAVGRYRLLIAAVGGVLLTAIMYWMMLNLDLRSDIYVEGTQHDMMMEWALSFQRLSIFGLPNSEIPVFFSFGYLGTGLDIVLRYGIWAAAAIGAYIASFGPLGVALAVVALLTKAKLTYPLIFVLLATIQLGTSRKPGRRV